MNIRNSWYRQKNLQQMYAYEEVPSIDELNKIIAEIHTGKTNKTFQTLRARALVAIYYLTAGRKSEVLGARKKDFKIDRIDNKRVLYIRISNRKNRNRKSKRQPIPIEKEISIFKHLFLYLKRLKPDDLLFEFKDKRATQIINDTLDWNVHFIRHIRLTHLVTLYDFNEQNLVKFAGWEDARPAKHYMELSPKDLFREFYKK